MAPLQAFTSLRPYAPLHQLQRLPAPRAIRHPVSMMPRLSYTTMAPSQAFSSINSSQGYQSMGCYSQQHQYNIRPFHLKSHHRVRSRPVEHEQMSQKEAQHFQEIQTSAGEPKLIKTMFYNHNILVCSIMT